MEKQEYVKMYRSQSTHWWYRTRRLFIQTFLEIIPGDRNKKILDVGCGTGANTQVLSSFGQVTGIDISPYAKKIYTKQKNASWRLGSAEKIPFKNNYFDIIVLLDVLYHKNIVYPAKAVQEAYRVLKPGGYCLITDCVHPFLFGLHDKQNQARERFTKRKVERLVRQGGFICVRSSYSFMMTFPVFLLIRLLDKLFNSSSISMEEKINTSMNTFLLVLGRLENRILKRLNLPFGSSVIYLVKKM